MTAKNAFTVDVEDYFQVSAFADDVPTSRWGKMEVRVVRNIENLLDLLSRRNVKGTFFVLGWIAEHYPGVVKSIAAEGHEVASHGFWHQRASEQTVEHFRADVDRSLKLLEDLTGKSVLGYRAPSFSINDGNQWVYDILAEVGYTYSSSTYPISHDHYGEPNGSRVLHKTSSGVWELPLSTIRVGGKNIPISGGGYFRLYPYCLTRWAIRRFHEEGQQTYNFYIHPWEMDPHQPRIQGLHWKAKLRHYLNLTAVESRLERLLLDHSWVTLESIVSAAQKKERSHEVVGA